ncbi:MAG: N4-gp56 family major capsid protein [Clostridia bacterium]|nr:N4-gp56 family major capsid protein [Clostridia bacterium]
MLYISDAITDGAKLIGTALQLFDESESTVETVNVSGVSVDGGCIYLTSEPASKAYTTGDKAYAGNAGRLGRDVYCTLVIGANAYGVIDILGGGLEHIVKQLGSAGTNDPINQRATVGWKAAISACVLAQEAMIRIETASSFESGAN